MSVIDVLRREGAASRADIARLTGLSRSTISSLITELQQDGLVVEREGDARSSTVRGGRPGVLVALQPKAGGAAAVDFGHTHLRVAVADLSSRVLAERHRRLDVDHSAAAALDLAAELIGEALAEAELQQGQLIGVGMGLPGPLDRETGTVGSAVILPGWEGLRPAAELERRLGIPVQVDNDANLGALGEWVYGRRRAVADLVYVKVASGIGAGLILGGRLHRGAHGIAGELGHVIGNRGCLETVAAAPALVEVLRRTYGDEFTTGDLLEQSDAGDLGCRRVLADAGRAIGRALADLVNCLNPAAVIVGGELSAAADPLLGGIRESIDRYALAAAAAGVELAPSALGDRAELLGALALVVTGTGIEAR